MPTPGLPPWDLFDGGFAAVTAGQLNDTIATKTITLGTGHATFPGVILGYPVDIWDAGTFAYASQDGNHEVAFVTSYTGTSMDITRNFLGTVAKDHTGAVNLVVERNLKAIEITSALLSATGGTPATQELRLTIVSSQPVPPDAGILNGTHIFLTPYKGDRIALYDNSNSKWRIVSTPEVDQDFTTIDGIAGAGMYDLFGKFNPYPDVGLFAVAWASDHVRATALDYQDGNLILTGDATKRFIGSAYWDGTNLSYSPSDRNVWNYYNRVAQTVVGTVGGVPVTTTSNTFQSASAGGNFVVGMNEDAAVMIGSAYATGDAGSSDMCEVGIGLGTDGPGNGTAVAIATASLCVSDIQGISAGAIGRLQICLFFRSVDGVHTVTLDDAYTDSVSNTVHTVIWG